MRNIVIKIRLIRLIRRQNQLAGLFQVDSNTQVSIVEMEFFQRYNKALIKRVCHNCYTCNMVRAAHGEPLARRSQIKQNLYKN